MARGRVRVLARMKVEVVALGLIAIVAIGCDAPPPAADAGPDAFAATCGAPDACDDHLFCTGVETCVSGRCTVGVSPCHAGQTCDEGAMHCFTTCAVNQDADGDDARAQECGGMDCDDNDAQRYPGRAEVCDVNDHDEDCDPTTYGFRDADGDGSPDARCCNVDPVSHERYCGRDCDDMAPGVNPNVPEVCNGIDDDCDGMIDENLIVHVTIDADHDGHGSNAPGAATMDTCRVEAGWAELADDCDDANANRFPGNPEICDMAMVDEDCSGVGNDVPGGCMCTGTQTEICGTMGRCAGATRMCDGIHGMWNACPFVPGTEVCAGDNVDEDCDGMIDEGLTVVCYVDNDGDGYAGDAAAPMHVCRASATGRQGAPWNGCPTGFTGRAPTSASDCCDSDANAYPGQTGFFATARRCGGFDYDCSGATSTEHPMRATTCSDSNGCRGTSTTDGWCSTVPTTCGQSGVSWGSGCWNGGAGCFPTTCFPTPNRCH